MKYFSDPHPLIAMIFFGVPPPTLPLHWHVLCIAMVESQKLYFCHFCRTKYNIEDSGCQSGMFEFRQKVRCDSPVRTVKTFTELL